MTSRILVTATEETVMTNSLAPRALVSQRQVPLCVPKIGGNEWKYVKECLDTNWVSSAGTFVSRFEQEIATYVGARHAVATVNGTAALHVALMVAGIRPDDEVLVSSLTFVAPANAIRYVGAWPVFIDAEPEHWQMDTQRAVDFLDTECHWKNGELVHKVTDRRVKAIIPVHILGHPCDMEPILEAARKYNLVVIEDATESLGARYEREMVGHLGDIACFSFNGNKLITTGGGGMIVTDNEVWARTAKHLTTQAKDDPVEAIHSTIGYNYRLTNIQAALGTAQTEKLDEYISQKRRIAETYRAALIDVQGLTLMLEAPWADCVYWLYTILVNEAKYGMSSRALLRQMQLEKIETRPLWQPLHISSAYSDNLSYQCPVAQRLNREAISLPSSVGLEVADQQRVIAVLRDLDQYNKRAT